MTHCNSIFENECFNATTLKSNFEICHIKITRTHHSEGTLALKRIDAIFLLAAIDENRIAFFQQTLKYKQKIHKNS